MRNFFQIAKNAFREALREPIFFVLLVCALFLIGLFPCLSLFVFREEIKMVVDSSMATTLVFGLITGVLSATHTVSREMRNGTVLLLMSKPVNRWSFVLAKIAGTLTALTVFVFLCDTATLISLYVAADQFQLNFGTLYIYLATLFAAAVYGAIRNYVSQASFSASAVGGLCLALPVLLTIILLTAFRSGHQFEHFNVVPALILLFFAVWAMGAITVAFSTRLNMVSNLVVCAALFMLGLVSNYFIGRSIDGNILMRLLYALIPNWQFFWMADALASQQNIPANYIGWAFAYICLYIGLCALLAMCLFRSKEVAGESR